jgi:streptogramin lyase
VTGTVGRRLAPLLAFALAGCASRGELIRPGDVVAANLGSHTVTVFDGETGHVRGTVAAAGLRNPTGVAFGPDGALYVASSGSDAVLRFDGRTGEFAGVFLTGPPLARPFSLIFGPDSTLYVSSGSSVLRYAFDGRHLGSASSGLVQPIGLALGADGTLFVANSTEGNVARFDPRSGESTGSPLGEDIAFASDVTIGPDGAVYVSSAGGGEVLRVDPVSGAQEVVVRLPEGGVPMGLAFRGPALMIGDFAMGRLFVVDPERPETFRQLADSGLVRPENLAVRPMAPAAESREPSPARWPEGAVAALAEFDQACRLDGGTLSLEDGREVDEVEAGVWRVVRGAGG